MRRIEDVNIQYRVLSRRNAMPVLSESVGHFVFLKATCNGYDCGIEHQFMNCYSPERFAYSGDSVHW